MKRIVVSWAVLGAAAMLVAFAPLPRSAPAPTERLIRVEAGDFANPVQMLSARYWSAIFTLFNSRRYPN